MKDSWHLSLVVVSISFSLSHFILAAADFPESTHDGIAFISIPAGKFIMGTTDANRAALEKAKAWNHLYECERPAHEVTISRPFLISKCEITQKQWREVMDKNPSAFKGPNLPVDSVSWEEVQMFIKKLNDRGKGRYRLPTEAEWEYCCRAGGAGLFGAAADSEGITVEKIEEFSWCRNNAGNRTHPVGEKKPNAWGLYDMHGNVWEWCLDWYGTDFYKKAPGKDPRNNEPGTERVFRGGSWFLEPQNLRAGFRGGNLPNFKSQYVGFRLVRNSNN